MSTYRLNKLFSPRSIAVVGASPRPDSLGRVVLKNLFAARFEGSIHVVNPHHREVEGINTVKNIGELADVPDIAIITTPPETVPGIVTESGAKGVAGVIIMTAGLGHGPNSLADRSEKAARVHGLRLVGPNCLGIIMPRAKLNASFAARMPKNGDLALISQSGALVAGIVDWAAQHSIGFSGIVSLGDIVDVDFGDTLDFFALDPATRAILLYVESIKDARKFMSAARAAASAKPVVVVKAGRHAQGAKAAATHTGALAGSDAVYDAAFRRAGLLRVYDLEELFDAAETLGSLKPFPGRRLAVLTNGGGIGVLAVDRLADLGGALATLSAETFAHLDRVLPPIWSRSNPVDIAGDADAARYAAALEALLADQENDAVLVMNVPTALASPETAADAVADLVCKERARWYPPKPVLAAWIGADAASLRAFQAARIPHYPTEAAAVRGFMHVVRYHEAVTASMETPPSLPRDFSPDLGTAHRIVESVVSEGRTWLDPLEVSELFGAYSISIAPTVLAHDEDEAAIAAAPFLVDGGTVVVKILSRDIVHKSDVDGVRLNLSNAQHVRDATSVVLANARRLRPDARIIGVTIHPMIVKPSARELIAGIADDPVFGPVVAFGHGGTAVEVIDDKALALPPLDLNQAQALIARTQISRLLKAYRNVPAANEADIALALVKLGQLAADLPEVREIDINPLLADEDGVLALDARVAVAPIEAKFKGPGHPRLAVRPYPKEWERRLVFDKNPVFVRPVRPEDEPAFQKFFEKIAPRDLRLRYFTPIKHIGHAFLARLTHLDYARTMAFVAIDEASGDYLGVVRLLADANYEAGEYAILIRSDLKGRGLGWKLMELIIAYARHQGLKRIEGEVLSENTVMLEMCEKFGFQIRPDPESEDVRLVTLALEGASA